MVLVYTCFNRLDLFVVCHADAGGISPCFIKLFMRQKKYYVYILTNKEKTVLYSGVTNDLEQRITEHYTGRESRHSFTSKYRCYYLLFYETFDYINNAITREKEIKGWRKDKKLQLIRAFNPEFMFLNEKLLGKWRHNKLCDWN